MARTPRLKQEGGYWKACVSGRKYSFGNVKVVSRIQAQAEFAKVLADGGKDKSASKPKVANCNVAKMYDDYLAWCAETRSSHNCTCKKSSLKFFCNWKPEDSRVPVKRMKAIDVTPKMILDYLNFRKNECPNNQWHDFTSLQAFFNWAAGTKEHPPSHLPENHRPFRFLKRPPKPKKELTGERLPTQQEVSALIDAAGQVAGLQDILVVLHGTGARPGELASARVEDFIDGQIVRHQHKNADRTEDARPRVIFLSGESLTVVSRRCQGRAGTAPIFTGGYGAAFTSHRVNKLFRKLRDELKLRDHIVPYSFRDLYISELLRLGVPVAKVAALVGTSTRMIERNYGHFFRSDLADVGQMLTASRSQARRSE